MTKTTNYSLPQWEVNDEVRREDFNAAMASIDTALETIDTALGEQKYKQETVHEQLWHVLFPMVEPQLKQKFATMDETALTREDNLLLNPLSSAEMADTLMDAVWDSTRKVNIGRRDAFERTYLRSYCTAHDYGTISASFHLETDSAYDFTAPQNATVTDFDLNYSFSFSEEDNTLTDVSLTFRAARKTGNSYTVFYEKSGLKLELSGTKYVTGYITVPVEVSLEQGGEYRFTLTLDSGYGCLGRYGFSTDTDADNSDFTVHPESITAGSHVRQIPLSRKHSYCLGVFRWKQEEGDSGMAPTLNGVRMEEWSRSEVADGDATVYEVTGLFTGDLTGSAVLSVDLVSSETDLVQLTGYGLYLM